MHRYIAVFVKRHTTKRWADIKMNIHRIFCIYSIQVSHNMMNIIRSQQSHWIWMCIFKLKLIYLIKRLILQCVFNGFVQLNKQCIHYIIEYTSSKPFYMVSEKDCGMSNVAIFDLSYLYCIISYLHCINSYPCCIKPHLYCIISYLYCIFSYLYCIIFICIV